MAQGDLSAMLGVREHNNQLFEFGVVISTSVKAVDSTKDALVCTGDLAGINTGRELIEAIARAIHAPEPYGRNWDALHELLRDLAWLQWDSLVLRLASAEGLLGIRPLDVVSVLKVLSDSSRYWKQTGRQLLTVLEGEDAKSLFLLTHNTLSDWRSGSI
jgi:hypothetical protein